MQSDKVLYLDATSTLIVWSGAETIGEIDDQPLSIDRSIDRSSRRMADVSHAMCVVDAQRAAATTQSISATTDG
eukprot:COSAG01_NODE_10434_length_2166_cov_8.532656_2_plen_74_part_00